MVELEEDAIAAACGRLGLLVSPAQRAQVAGFFQLLLAWNARINLTGARTAGDLISEHLPDSVALARVAPARAKVLDVGSGGGLPGIPFALLRPDCQVTLVEPRAKRVAFLRTAVRETRVTNASVVAGRLEHLGAGPERFDVACSRATFPPPDWLRLALPVLGPGGRVVVFAAQRWNPEEPALARLVDGMEYQTGNGRARWVGTFAAG